jgi:hypothetical protein
MNPQSKSRSKPRLSTPINRSSDRLEHWEQKVLELDFSQMPVPFRWEQSARFAHFLNGYEAAGGLDQLARLHGASREAAIETGRWRGDASELWSCLFFEHRSARHTGSEPEGDHLRLVNALCEQLRQALQSSDNVTVSKLTHS